MSELKKMIEEGNIEDCLNKMLSITKITHNSIHNNCIMLMSQYKHWKEQELQNLEPPLSVRNKIELSTLQLIDEIEKDSSKDLKLDFIKKIRVNKLLGNMQLNIELLTEWEQKKDLSSNPSEKKLCELEIERLKESIKKYQSEYYNLA